MEKPEQVNSATKRRDRRERMMQRRRQSDRGKPCADLRAFLSSARRRRSTTFGLCFEMTRMEEILETPEHASISVPEAKSLSQVSDSKISKVSKVSKNSKISSSGFSIEVTACADLRAFLSSARRRRSTTFGLCFEKGNLTVASSHMQT
jgi:hypothetical protein